MKTIHLLRHAKSSWSESGLEDHDRPLDERGDKDARALAKALHDSPLPLDLVVCSTARRARQTLEPLIAAIGKDVPIRFEKKLFHASPATLLGLLRALPKRVDRVLVVAHSPGLDGLVDLLAGRGDIELRDALAAKLPTCTLVTLKADVDRFADVTERSATLVSAIRGRRKKSARAFAEPEKPKATKAKRIDLDASARWSEAAAEVLAACRAHAEANVEGAEDGDVESVHQLRVALRRTRVALQFFGRLVDEKDRETLRLDLRWLAGTLGDLREAQVFEEDMLVPMREHTPRSPALVALARATEAAIAVRAHATRAALRGPRGKQTFRRLEGLAFVDARCAHERARKRAGKRLDRRLERALEHAGAAERHDPAELHELRKELKKLRYAGEFVASLFDGDAVHAYVGELEHLQDVIGVMQDEVVSRRIVGELLRGHEGEKHLARAEALVNRFERAKKRRDGKALERAIARFVASEPFWR